MIPSRTVVAFDIMRAGDSRATNAAAGHQTEQGGKGSDPRARELVQCRPAFVCLHIYSSIGPLSHTEAAMPIIMSRR